MGFLKSGLGKVILTVITGLVMVLVVLSILRVGIAFWLYSQIAQWATVRLGMDYYGSELMAVIFSSAIMYMIPGIGTFILSHKKRLLGSAVIIGGYLLMTILVYTVGRNVYFNRVTGESMRYFVDTPEGREFSFTPGFHPKYGVAFKPYTQEEAQREILRRKAQLEQQQRIEAENRKRQERDAQRQAEVESKRMAIEQQKAEAEVQQQAMEEARKQEAERHEQEERARQETARQTEEATKKAELERQKVEQERQWQQAELRRQQEYQQQLERQRLESEERQKQIELQRLTLAERHQQRIEQQRREEEARRREQDEKARRTERNRQITRTIETLINTIPRRR